MRAVGLKLRSIVLSRSSLRRLLTDRNGAIKIEYLQRDLIRSAPVRSEFAYPRHSDVAPGYCRQPCCLELAHAVIERRRRHVHALAQIHRNQIPDEFTGLADVLDRVLPRN